MSDGERTGWRTLKYSGWHRVKSLSRFTTKRVASEVAMIDIDACEYCRRCSQPLALIETAESRGEPKAARVTQALAALAGIEAYSVSYWSDGPDPDCERCSKPMSYADIVGFKVRRIQPYDPAVVVMSPVDYTNFLLDLRFGHQCQAVERRSA